MKKSLSQVTFECIVQALQTYKKSDNLDVLLTKTTVLSEDANTHSLLRGKSSVQQHSICWSLHIYSVSSDLPDWHISLLDRMWRNVFQRSRFLKDEL